MWSAKAVDEEEKEDKKKGIPLHHNLLVSTKRDLCDLCPVQLLVCQVLENYIISRPLWVSFGSKQPQVLEKRAQYEYILYIHVWKIYSHVKCVVNICICISICVRDVCCFCRESFSRVGDRRTPMSDICKNYNSREYSQPMRIALQLSKENSGLFDL